MSEWIHCIQRDSGHGQSNVRELLLGNNISNPVTDSPEALRSRDFLIASDHLCTPLDCTSRICFWARETPVQASACFELIVLRLLVR